MNKSLLRSVMVLHSDTDRDLADYLGISAQSFSNKINENKSEFKQGEISLIKKRYHLSADEIDAIFFGKAVS